MLNLVALRFIIGVIGGIAGLALLYTAVDWIGDQREAKVWAQIDKTVTTFNEDQEADNTLDANERALRQRLRQAALLNAAAIGRRSSQDNACLLTAEEATAIGAIK